jgi:hypothetical protein
MGVERASTIPACESGNGPRRRTPALGTIRAGNARIFVSGSRRVHRLSGTRPSGRRRQSRCSKRRPREADFVITRAAAVRFLFFARH